jgi:hypothetical protein
MLPTGHKTFDQQAASSFLGRGNVAAATQYSSFLRAYHHPQASFPGALFDFDFKPFQRWLSPSAQTIVRHHCQHEDHLLYVFYHHQGRRRIIDCWILTKATKPALFVAGNACGPTRASGLIYARMLEMTCDHPSAHDRLRHLAHGLEDQPHDTAA